MLLQHNSFSFFHFYFLVKFFLMLFSLPFKNLFHFCGCLVVMFQYLIIKKSWMLCWRMFQMDNWKWNKVQKNDSNKISITLNNKFYWFWSQIMTTERVFSIYNIVVIFLLPFVLLFGFLFYFRVCLLAANLLTIKSEGNLLSSKKKHWKSWMMSDV